MRGGRLAWIARIPRTSFCGPSLLGNFPNKIPYYYYYTHTRTQRHETSTTDPAEPPSLNCSNRIALTELPLNCPRCRWTILEELPSLPLNYPCGITLAELLTELLQNYPCGIAPAGLLLRGYPHLCGKTRDFSS